MMEEVLHTDGIQMANHKVKEKLPPPRFWFILNVIAFLAVPAFCVLTLFWVRQDVRTSRIDDYNSTPGPWYECSFAFTDGSSQVTLMRRRLPGIAGFHAEHELRMLLQTVDNRFTIIRWGYTESSNTDVYASTALLQDNRRVPVLRVESYGSTYHFDMESMRELSFRDVTDEFNGVYLGHFDGVDEFVTSHPSVTTLSNQCGIPSSTE
jgi:hypothetical protein